jgi:integrase
MTAATRSLAATGPAVSLPVLCARVRPELGALGDVAVPLLSVLAVVERAGASLSAEALADPGFALDVLTAAGPGVEAATVGRVLDFLRTRAATVTGPAGVGVAVREALDVAEAVRRYEAGPLAVLAKNTRTGYQAWVRRLAAAHGAEDPAAITAGDLRDLIAMWTVKAREANQDGRGRKARQGGKTMGAVAVNAFRHLLRYWVEKGWVPANIAAGLTKPALPEPNRRPFRPEEAALVRQLARSRGRDPLLDEVIVTIAERMGLRRAEVYGLRICDVDLERRVAWVMGKGDKPRDVPIPPVLAGLLERYLEDRRPAGISRDRWRRSSEYLLRSRPTERCPDGRRAGRERPDAIFGALREAAPELFVNRDQSLHCYRHTLGTWIERHYGRKATRAVLGHRGRQEATDYYVYVPLEEQAAMLAAYEGYLLAGDPTHGTNRSHDDDRAMNDGQAREAA